MAYDQFSDSSAEDCLVGNSNGIDFLKNNRRLERDVTSIREALLSLKDHVEERDHVIEDHEKKLQNHKQEIEQLRLFSIGARRIRSRFLENEKRRHENSSVPHRRIVESGNSFAHEPEALLDAHLYTDGERTDIHTYIRIYGIHPQKVIAACKFNPPLEDTQVPYSSG